MSGSSPSSAENNPYHSTSEQVDSRGKLGWLTMLVVMWPVVMGLSGAIVGYLIGRITEDMLEHDLWNPSTATLVGGIGAGLVGLLIGLRKATSLRAQLDQIHARRQELREEILRQRGAP
ncbi:MAG: hypothetical protein SGJ20_10310 [Planctomycetota bacterium]|nr:hypothetical protein [Planctomycetota bacterium]